MDFDDFGGFVNLDDFGDFDPVQNAETALRAGGSEAEREMLLRMLRGVRETNEISPDPDRGRILRRWEKAGLVRRFKVRGKHLAGLTEAGEALAREFLPKPEKPKGRSAKGKA